MAIGNEDPNATAADDPHPTATPPASAGGSQEETLPPATEPAASASAFTPAQLVALGLPNIPGYELHVEIGRGAMGIVFKALQVDLKRVVALKMILSGNQAASAEVQRFRMEAEAAAKLDHPAIVPIYHVDEHDGHHFFSMKLVEGGTLASRISEFSAAYQEGPGKKDEWRRESGVDLNERQISIATLLAKVAEAIHCAHQQGILHRDLKPGNILLDSRSEPHVADFGLAKRVEGDSVLTQTGVIVGTPSYMAPEQATGKKNLTPAADIYSLGAILYELLTGRPPFKAETIVETLVQVVEREPISPRSLNRAVSRDLETICMKALAKDPARRFASAQEMADELKRFAAGQTIKTRPAGFIEQIARRVKRNPVVAGLSGAILLLSLVVAGLLLSRVRFSDGSLDRVRAAGKLVIAIDDNYPPMEFRKNGELTGFDHDLAKEIASRLGVSAEFQVRHWDWSQVPMFLEKHDCDMVISSWTITPERKQEAAFVEYLRTVLVFTCKKGIHVRTEKDLTGKRVIVGGETVQHKYLVGLEKKGDVTFTEFHVLKAGEEPFPVMKKGLADVTVVDEPVGRYQAMIDPDFVVTGTVGHAMNPDPVGMVFRIKDVQLQEAVAKALAAMKEDKKYDEILQKWFGK